MARFYDTVLELVDPLTEEPIKKVVFSILCIGKMLEERIRKTCAQFDARVYAVPDGSVSARQLLAQLEESVAEKSDIARRTSESIKGVLSRLARADPRSARRPLRDAQAAVREETAVCGAFMKGQFYQTMITFEGWCPTKDLDALKACVHDAAVGTGSPPAAVNINPRDPVKPPGDKPTYFDTNKFTGSFQVIVDTYGVPRYQEANPGMFTIVSFPFLFGVMYGDIGHGFLLTLFGLYMVLNEKKLLSDARTGKMGEIFSMAFGGRYVILLMGIFGFYVGTIYNDCMSVSIHLFDSTYELPSHNATSYAWKGQVYPYGLDPVYYYSGNELAFLNSFKMKTAVVLGVIQMTFGILLSLANHIYFKDTVSIWFEFVPRFIFLQCTFGYMVVTIIVKYCIDWSVSKTPPPNLIQSMIGMFLNTASVDPEKQLFAGQATVQVINVLLAFISIPVMLLGKPLINHYYKKKSAEQFVHLDVEAFSSASEEGAYAPAAAQHGGHGGHEEHSLSDEMIHQAIHTIEYVLGTVSNTASYLRLWALSLAHAELAQVFWNKLMYDQGYKSANAFSIVIGFGAWFGATVAVLLCMDVLECFLHALRLHWVEFQNKFFYADGYAFQPFVLTGGDEISK
jgi:V-type H+-transporting ATPase subunit a